MWKSSYSVLVGLFLTLSSSSANDSVIGLELEYRLRVDGTGHYNIMWQHLNELGLSRVIDAVPFKRGYREFSEDENSCIFPTSVSSLSTSFPHLKDKNFIASVPLDYVSMKVMTRHGEEPITQLSQLNDKRVALWNGLDPEIFLSGLDVEIETTAHEGVRLRMLYSNRVDAILGFLPDTLIAADSLGYEYPTHEDAFNFFQSNGVSVVCFDSESNRAFIAEFDGYISELKNNGKLRDILGPHVILVTE